MKIMMNEWVMNVAANLLTEDTECATTQTTKELQKIPCPAEYSWMGERWDEMSAEDQATWVREVPLDDPDWRGKHYLKNKIHAAFCDSFEKANSEIPGQLTWCPDMYTRGFDTFTFGCKDRKYNFEVYDVEEGNPYEGQANIKVFVKDSSIKYPNDPVVSCFYVKKDTIPNEAKSIFKITNRLFNDGLEKFNADNGYVKGQKKAIVEK